MPIVFTGLAQEVCANLIQSLDKSGQVRLLTAEEALSSTPARVKPGRVVWFYRAPWALPETWDACQASQTAEEILSLWLKHHRALLRKRRAWGTHLLLVNADRVDFRALLDFLNLPAEAAKSERVDRDSFSVLNALLARSFESSFAEHWDVFEALEALAWHSGESSPDEAEDLAMSDAAVLNTFQLLLDSRALPGTKDRLAKAQVQVQQHGEELVALRGELEQARRDATQLKATHLQTLEANAQTKAKLEADVTTLRDEGRSLLAQLHRVQEELEKTYLESRGKLVAADKQRAELAGELTKLQAELKEQADMAAATTAALTKLQKEKSTEGALQGKLKAELAQLHNEKAAVTAAAEKLQRELDTVRLQLAQEVRARERTTRQAVEQAQAKLKVLQEENELMLLQMHQVQEELERYFFENRQLHEFVTQSRDSQDRARKLISRLMMANGVSPLPIPDSAPVSSPVST